jgi:hypothetical protein
MLVEKLLHSHKASPEMQIPRFPKNLGQCFLSDILSLKEGLPYTLFGKKLEKALA